MIHNLGLSFLSGVITALAFPITGLAPLAWISLIPLLWVLDRTPGAWKSSICGVVFGMGFFGTDLYWVYETVDLHGHAPKALALLTTLGLVLLLSIFTGLFGLATGLIKDKSYLSPSLIPFIWVGIEYARANLLTGFPWDLLGYSQANFLSLIQIADITGVYGVSFVIVLANVSIVELFKYISNGSTAKLRNVVFGALIIGATLTYGAIKLHNSAPKSASNNGWTVGVLQGAIPQELKWLVKERQNTVDTYTILGEEALQSGARALIWPETSLPTLFMGEDPFWKTPCVISQDLGVPILFGAPYEIGGPGSSIYVNSAILIDGFDLLARYDKIHLVPFGEYMPLSWLIPLGPGLAAREADYVPGHDMKVMSLPGGPPFSVLICYEAIFPELSRLAINKGARLLINITNDAWFGSTAAPYQHFAMSRFRAIENRAWLVRCANTGISAVVDPTGRIRKSIPLNQRDFFNHTFSENLNAGSFYTFWGDIFAWVSIVICIMWPFAIKRPKRINPWQAM